MLGARPVNTKALIFNVKGEDLLFLDHPNTALGRRAARRATQRSACRSARSAASRCSLRRDAATPTATPDVGAPHRGRHVVLLDPRRSSAATSCCRSCSPTRRTIASSTRWSCSTSRPGSATRHRDRRRRRRASKARPSRTFRELVDVDRPRSCEDDDPVEAQRWAGRAIGAGTVNAFIRRLYGAVRARRAPHPGRRRARRTRHQVGVRPSRSRWSTCTTSTTGPSASSSASCCGKAFERQGAGRAGPSRCSSSCSTS